MIRNYFVIALRNLLKNLLHTSINVWGLAFGMASVFLITVYINGELSYDKFHQHPENLYRIVWVNENPQTRTPHPMAQALVSDFPEVEAAVSLSPLFAAGLTKETHSFRDPNKKERYDEQNILSVDTTFFDVFDFPIVEGNAKAALKQAGAILISESMAHKYFGDQSAIGKFIAVDSADYLVQVLAVFKDIPENSHFHFDFLVSYVREKSLDPDASFYSWKDFGHYNYLRLKPGTDAKVLEGKLMDWTRKYLNWSSETYSSMAEQHFGFQLQPITDIHLHSKLRWELEPNGNAEYVFILGAAAFFTLLIACVNFMNLTTAKSAERAKEIGVRKTMGAFRYQLAFQFLAESVSTALIAVVLSIIIIELSLPLFAYLLGHPLQIHYVQYIFFALGGAFLIGLISGVYPALYLSGVSPHSVLKGKLIQSAGGVRFRKTLIVVQFSISMILISSAIIIYNQLSFLRDKNLGFDKENILIIPIKNDEGFKRFDALKNGLVALRGVRSVSAASNIPGHQFNQHSISLNGTPSYRIDASESFVDYDFFKAMNVETKEGRNFLRENPGDRENFILNETAARQLKSDGKIVGEQLIWRNDQHDMRGTIIGIVKDFHFQSLHEPIRPILFKLTKSAFNYLLVKVSVEDFSNSIKEIEKVYKEFEPTYGFEFEFLDDDLNRQYNAEQKTGILLSIYSGLALLIACFGLFGMSMMLYYQKAKELSIRKILGASFANLIKMLLTDFTILILISVAI
ncbi:MAG: ABC transporter permease, partial [Chryseolinea sp.]